MALSIFGFNSKTPEQQFWNWFEKNQEMIFSFEKDRDNVFNKLAIQMKKVNEDLTFEFGPISKEGNREFVISADGIIKSFPSVEKLFKSAPQLKKWTIIKFRPRRKPMTVNFGGIEVKPADVNCQLFKDNGKVGVMLFFKGFNSDEENSFSRIGYLILDQAIGEYDVETKVGFIEFSSQDSKYFENSFPLLELPSRFDEQFQ